MAVWGRFGGEKEIGGFGGVFRRKWRGVFIGRVWLKWTEMDVFEAKNENNWKKKLRENLLKLCKFHNHPNSLKFLPFLC
jgi:hypothetical protein